MKALILAARHPWPTRRGDQMRARDFAAGFSALGADVELLCAGEAGRATPATSRSTPATGGPGSEQAVALGPDAVDCFPSTVWDRLSGAVAWLGGEPLQAGMFRSAGLRRAALQRLDAFGHGDVVLLQLARQEPLLRSVVEHLQRRPLQQRPVVLVDLIDTLSLNFRLRSDLDAAWLRWFWRLEAQRLERAEARVAALSDAVCVVCERDRRALQRLLDGPAAESAGAQPRCTVVPLPIDAGSADAAKLRRHGSHSNTFSGESTVVLTGNLGYFVNHQAALWFLDNAWPAIKQRCPAARLLIAGSRPRSELVRRVAAEDAAAERAGTDGVEIEADPADLRAMLRRGTVAVAPLFGGAGVPVKILEAWAEGVPVVATSWARDGLIASSHQSDGEAQDKALTVVDEDRSPNSWAQSVCQLLEDEDLRARLVAEGRARLERNHSQQAFMEGLNRLVEIGHSKPEARSSE